MKNTISTGVPRQTHTNDEYLDAVSQSRQTTRLPVAFLETLRAVIPPARPPKSQSMFETRNNRIHQHTHECLIVLGDVIIAILKNQKGDHWSVKSNPEFAMPNGHTIGVVPTSRKSTKQGPTKVQPSTVPSAASSTSGEYSATLMKLTCGPNHRIRAHGSTFYFFPEPLEAVPIVFRAICQH